MLELPQRWWFLAQFNFVLQNTYVCIDWLMAEQLLPVYELEHKEQKVASTIQGNPIIRVTLVVLFSYCYMT